MHMIQDDYAYLLYYKSKLARFLSENSLRGSQIVVK